MVFTWLIGAGIGPAAVGLPVSMAGEAVAGAAQRWFQRVRHTDDLSRLVRAATGNSVALSRSEFNDVRKLLEDPETWRSLGQGTEADLARRILPCLPACDGRAAADSQAAADTIAHGLLEFAVADLEPKLFQKLLLARLARLERHQTEGFDEALLRMHADLVTRLAGQGELDDRHFAQLIGHVKRVLEQSPPGPADRGEIVIYLNTLISWLSTDPWPHRFEQAPLSSPAIERRMRLTSPANPDDELDADDLTGRCQRLVILGGPGSGKTWLARRAARMCAEAALRALAAGLPLDEVELPLYTTCSRLASADGDIRQAVISGALERIGDLGGSRISASLKEFYAERNAPTLLVLDSLDEAPGADDRLREADSLGPPWRIVLTSRPGSWHNQLQLDTRNPSHRTGLIQPLRYPDDVEPFIQAWFGDRPEWAADLAVQIAGRPDLQQPATVPLILAFYCIVGGSQPLPEFRGQLYAKVLACLVTSRWRGTGGQPDTRTCLTTLRSWAWQWAISDDLSGTGNWPDDILTGPTGLGEADEAALGNVAPPLGLPDPYTGKVTRRFLHRSLREYLVAQYVAGLSVDDAVAALLPHLWYDPDWEVAAPAAIACHPRKEELLAALARAAAESGEVPEDLSLIDGGGEFRVLLARVATESGEADWSPASARMIGQARIHLARAGRTDVLGGAAEWGTSTGQARDMLLDLLAGETRTWVASALLDGVVQLTLTDNDRRQVVPALLRLAGKTAIPRDTDMLNAVFQMGPTGADRTRLRSALLALLAGRADTDVEIRLPGQLASLGGTAGQRQQIRMILLRKLAATSDRDSKRLVDEVIRFAPTAPERHQASLALLGLLAHQAGSALAAELLDSVAPGASPAREWNFHLYGREELLRTRPDEFAGTSAAALVSGLVQLARTAEEKRFARATLQRLLPGQPASPADMAVLHALAQLARTAADKRFLRGVLLGLLPAQPASQDPANVATWLALQLLGLSPTPEDVRRARGTLLGLLDVALGEYSIGLLVAGVLPLALARTDKRETRAALLRVLTRQDDIRAVRALLNGVVQLHPTATDRRQARATLLALLAGETYGATAADLVQELVRLNPTASDRRQARATLLALLASETQGHTAAGLAQALARLDPTAVDRRRARAALLRVWPATTAYWQLEALIGAMAQLDPSAEDKRQMYAVLPDKLAAGTDGWDAADVARELMKLDPVAADKRRVRAALLGLLGRQTEDHMIQALLDAIIQLDPTAGGKRFVCAALLRLLGGQADGWTAASLMRGITQLDPRDDEQQRARAALLRLLGTVTDIRAVRIALVGALLSGDLASSEKQQAREILLSRLAGEADPGRANTLVNALAQFAPSAADLRGWPGWAARPDADLLTAVRRNSPLAAWTSLLPSLAQLAD